MKTNATLDEIAAYMKKTMFLDGVIIIAMKDGNNGFGFAGMDPLTILAFQQGLVDSLKPMPKNNILQLVKK